MTVDFCLAAERVPDLPAFTCVWSDGTQVTGAPPPAECPPNVREDVVYCGGACGSTPCAEWDALGDGRLQGSNDCMGVSNDRGFGFCGYQSPIRHGLPVNPSFVYGCETRYDAPCALLQLVPDAVTPSATEGSLALAEQCLDYRSHYPDHVRCWTPEGELMP